MICYNIGCGFGNWRRMMTDHDSKYYRKKWMTEDQWECAKLAARICGGFHHMGKVEDAGNGVCCEIFKSEIATFDFSEMTRIVVLAHDACIRVGFGHATRDAEYEGNEYEEHYSRLILHKRQREGSMSQRHPTLEDHIALIRGVTVDA
jgi:hypothetical protein